MHIIFESLYGSTKINRLPHNNHRNQTTHMDFLYNPHRQICCNDGSAIDNATVSLASCLHASNTIMWRSVVWVIYSFEYDFFSTTITVNRRDDKTFFSCLDFVPIAFYKHLKCCNNLRYLVDHFAKKPLCCLKLYEIINGQWCAKETCIVMLVVCC